MQKGFAQVFILIGLIVTLLIGGAGYFIYQNNFQNIRNINSFEDCAKYYPVMESYPAQCNTPDGRHFVQELSEEEKKKLNTIENPLGIKQLPDASPPTKEELKTWRKYIHKQFGYEISYPPEVKIKENPDFEQAGNLGQDQDQVIFEVNNSQLEVIINPAGRGIGSGDMKKIKAGNIEMNKINTSTNSAIVSGIGLPTGGYLAIFIDLSTNPLEAAKANELFDKMLTTLTFTSYNK